MSTQLSLYNFSISSAGEEEITYYERRRKISHTSSELRAPVFNFNLEFSSTTDTSPFRKTVRAIFHDNTARASARRGQRVHILFISHRNFSPRARRKCRFSIKIPPGVILARLMGGFACSLAWTTMPIELQAA